MLSVVNLTGRQLYTKSGAIIPPETHNVMDRSDMVLKHKDGDSVFTDYVNGDFEDNLLVLGSKDGPVVERNGVLFKAHLDEQHMIANLNIKADANPVIKECNLSQCKPALYEYVKLVKNEEEPTSYKWIMYVVIVILVAISATIIMVWIGLIIIEDGIIDTDSTLDI
jgi:hypothetical protein